MSAVITGKGSAADPVPPQASDVALAFLEDLYLPRPSKTVLVEPTKIVSGSSLSSLHIVQRAPAIAHGGCRFSSRVTAIARGGYRISSLGPCCFAWGIDIMKNTTRPPKPMPTQRP